MKSFGCLWSKVSLRDNGCKDVSRIAHKLLFDVLQHRSCHELNYLKTQTLSLRVISCKRSQRHNSELPFEPAERHKRAKSRQEIKQLWCFQCRCMTRIQETSLSIVCRMFSRNVGCSSNVSSGRKEPVSLVVSFRCVNIGFVASDLNSWQVGWRRSVLRPFS